MKLPWWISRLLVLSSVFPSAASMTFYDPQLCYILDGFLGLFGLLMTGLFIKEKFYKTKVKVVDESLYSDLEPRTRDISPYAPLRDPEKGGRNRRPAEDSVYTDLQKHKESSYKELPAKKERHRNNDVYQGLSSATRDTYDSLQMQPLSTR